MAAKGTLTLPISTVLSLTAKTPPVAHAIMVSGMGRSQFEGEIRGPQNAGLLLARKALRV